MTDTPLKAGVEIPAADVPRVRRASLVELYRKHLAELTRYISGTFGAGPPEPEDVVHEAFAQFAALENSQAIENPRAFLYRSAHNLVIDHHRRSIVRNRFAREEALAVDAERSGDDDGERVLDARQRLAIVEETIRAMEPRRRTVFVLNRIHELSYAEISRRLRIPETTVKRLVAAGIIECERSLRARGVSGEERP